MQTASCKYLSNHNYTNFDIKAILFDMDGVLVDSMKWHAKSWHETMMEYDIESTPDEFYLYEGVVGRNTINDMIRRGKGRDATEAEQETIYKRKTELFVKYNDNALIPFSYEFVNKVNAEGLICGVVTGSGQKALIDRLDTAFPNVFKKSLMVTAYDVRFGKPHPEPYLMGLERVGCLKPNQAIVIENAPKGVEAAVAAGIFTIAVNTGPLSEQVLRDSGADIVYPSMEALYNDWANIRLVLNIK